MCRALQNSVILRCSLRKNTHYLRNWRFPESFLHRFFSHYSLWRVSHYDKTNGLHCRSRFHNYLQTHGKMLTFSHILHKQSEWLAWSSRSWAWEIVIWHSLIRDTIFHQNFQVRTFLFPHGFHIHKYVKQGVLYHTSVIKPGISPKTLLMLWRMWFIPWIRSTNAPSIRRPESACSSNNLMQNPNRSQNPKSKIRNPKSKIQNPKSKIQNPNGRVWGCHKKNGYYDNPKSKIQNPRSKIQNPKSEIQDPKSKIQSPKSKLQTPKSKRPVWILDFGVWIWVAGLGWLCSKRSCVDGLATQIWRSW